MTPSLFFDYLPLCLAQIALAIPLQKLCSDRVRRKNESQIVKRVVIHLLLLRCTQTGNTLLLRSALRYKFGISCLLPGFSLSLVLETLGKVFTRFLYLAFSLRAEIDLLESVDEAKDGGYEGRGDVDM